MLPVTASLVCWPTQILCVCESITQRTTNHSRCREGRETETERARTQAVGLMSGLVSAFCTCFFVGVCMCICGCVSLQLKKVHTDLSLALRGEENVRRIKFFKSRTHTQTQTHTHAHTQKSYPTYTQQHTHSYLIQTDKVVWIYRQIKGVSLTVHFEKCLFTGSVYLCECVLMHVWWCFALMAQGRCT